MNEQPQQTAIGAAVKDAIDGNEPVAVGMSVAALIDAVIGFSLYKEWILPEDLAMITPITVALIALIGVVVRQKVYSKRSAAQLLATEPRYPMSEANHELLRV